MRAEATAAAAALKRIKRAQGLLRAAVVSLAHELDDVDVVGEARVEPGDARALEAAIALVRLSSQRPGAIDVVVLSTPADDRGRDRQLEETPATHTLGPRERPEREQTHGKREPVGRSS